MKQRAVSIFYIYLFITHIILGPYWYLYTIKGETPIYFTDSLYKVSKRILYITYVSLLAFVWFLYHPTTEHYFIALLLSLFALIIFANFRNPTLPHHNHSLLIHTIMLIPFLVSFKYFKINLTKIKFTNSTTLFVLYMVVLLAIIKPLYS